MIAVQKIKIKAWPGQPAAVWWIIAILFGLALARLPLSLSAAIIGLTAVFLLTLINPLIGLGVALLLAPLGALENILLGSSLLDSGQLMLFVALAAWLGRGLLRREIILPSTPLTIPLLLFILLATVSLPDALSHSLGLIELLKWVEIALIIWMVVEISRQHRNAALPTQHLVLFILLLAGLCQALVGIWQFGLRGGGPEHFLVLGNFYRAYGTFEQPNPYGGYMNLTALLALGVLIGLAAAWRSRRKIVNCEVANHSPLPTLHSPLLFWLFVALTAAATTLGLIFSWSRGAWLGFAAGLATLVLLSPRKWWQGVVLLLGGAGLAAVLLSAGVVVGFAPAAAGVERIAGFREDLTFGDVRGVDINDANYAVLERLAHWQAALDMARDDLWTGVGFGNYETAYPAYALINWPDALGHAHNYYLNLLAETGLPGLVAYAILWLAILWQSLRLLRQLPWPERGICLGLTSCWIALSVHHLVDKLYVNNVYIHLGVMLALLQLLDSGVSGVRRAHQSAVEV